MLGLISGIIGGLSSVLSVVAKLAPAVIKIVGAELTKFAKALEAFFTALGVFKPEEKVEDVGDKALQAEKDETNPIKVEDFDSHEEYMKKLEEYEPDPEKSKLIPEEDKIHKGIEIMIGLTIEKFGEAMAELYPIILKDPAFYSAAGRLEGIAKAAQNNKDTLGEIVGYLSGKNTDSKMNDRAFDALFDVEKSVNPGASDREIMAAVSEMQGKK